MDICPECESDNVMKAGVESIDCLDCGHVFFDHNR